MENQHPKNIPSKIIRAIGSIPNDTVMIAQRFLDHAIEPRTSPGDTSALFAELDYHSIAELCQEAGLPAHLAERWSRFGISNEMRQIIVLMVTQRKKTKEAIEEFEAMTHVGVDDYMRDRGLL